MSWPMTEQTPSLGSLCRSFGNALRGVGHCLKRERNMRIHLGAAVLVTAFSAVCTLSPLEYALLFLTMGVVLAAEALNTAIERTVDLVTHQRHPLARAAKDAAAAGVLLAALGAAAAGAALFLPEGRLLEGLARIAGSPLLTAVFLLLAVSALVFAFFGERLLSPRRRHGKE